VERGYTRQLYACKKTDRLIYTNNKTVIVRSFANPEDATVFCGHKMNANVACPSPNGEWVASGDAGGDVIIWNVKNGNIKNTVPIAGQPIADVNWDFEGKRIMAVGDGSASYGRFFTWDTGNACGDIMPSHTKRIIACALNHGRPGRALTCGEDNLVVAFNGPPYKKDHAEKVHTRFPNNAQFHPSNEWAITVGSDGKIVVYNGKELTVAREIESKEDGHKGAISGFCFNADGSKFVTSSFDKTAKIWDFEKGTVDATFTMGTETSDQQMSCVWHKDWIVSVSLSGALNYLDPANPGKPCKILVGHMESVTSLVTDPTNKRFFSADAAGQVCIWENNTATWLTGKGHAKGVNAIALTSDGSKIVSVGMDDTVRFNDVKECAFADAGIPCGGSPISVACGKSTADLAVVGIAQGKLTVVRGGSAKSTEIGYKPVSLAFNPDDSKLVVGGADKCIHIYSVSGDDLKEEHVNKSHNHQVEHVSFSNDGKYYCSSSGDKTTLVFDAATHEQKNGSSWEFHTMSVNSHAWSPDQKIIATVANDLSMFIWNDTEKFGIKKTKLAGLHSVTIKSVGWLDANTIVTLGGDGCIKIWNV
jgi:WD40 repeat protein